MAENETLFQVTSMFRTLLKTITHEWNKNGSRYNLSLPQFKILYSLQTKGPQNVSQLAEALGITSAAITGATDKLLAEGLVLRERGEADRRVVFVTLTDAGKAILEEVKKDQQIVLDKVFHMLPQEDIQHLKRIYGQMLANVDNPCPPGQNSK
ncbi:MarR family winged helix-turn-helix transcriptional regulator [Paenibacillus protaetiae]|uniref:MarR family transcriptional regulator n=1 Tax=Paenibacillus protaetiae TaxID=2509456 RepID=A0A4P6EVJ2_9BACL|nr:MarR family transcriptional regulator [Paenibacillus protaetiae]QAY67052.1 MarR family transcriptional regulator [Paenibacillus protaetiae]